MTGCPDHLTNGFIFDVEAGFTNKEMGAKYNKHPRTIRKWKKALKEAGQLLPEQASAPKPGLTFKIDGNYAVAESRDDRIRTLADLLSAAKVDLSTWKVRDQNGFEVKAWEGYAANVDKSLEYDAGQATGHVKRKGITTTTLWSVRASLIRINPIPLKPLITPIDFPQCPIPKVDPTKSQGIAMVIADTHFGFEWEPPQWKLKPFHDRRVLDIFLQILEIVQPDVVEIDGDLLDLPMLQDKFLREPKFFNTTQPALLECAFFLRKIVDISPESKKRAHEGNHSLRLDKYLITHAREVYGLQAVDELELPPSMSMPKLLALHKLGIDWIDDYPDDISWLGKHIQVSHGAIARVKPLATVTATLQQGRYHRVVGHIHRDELVSESREMSNGHMRQITGYCPGCACHTDGRLPGAHTTSNWRNGIGIIEWSGQNMSVTHIPIVDGVAVWQRQKFEARDWVGPLKETHPDWNW